MSSSPHVSANSDSAAPPVAAKKPVLVAVKAQPVVPPAPPGARITGIPGASRLAAVPAGSAMAAPVVAPALMPAAPPPAISLPAEATLPADQKTAPPAALPAAPPAASAAPVPLVPAPRKPEAAKPAAKRPAKTVSLVTPIAIRPVVALARLRPRHRLLMASFALVVLLPILVSAAYLWGKAVDQYASTVGFSVRREEGGAALDVLGGLTSLSASGSSDADILYEYLRSQKLVADLDAKLNLRGLWSKPESDPVFAFDTSGSIEDLLDYWQSMVRTSYDSTTGLIEVQVLAFDPKDATMIAQAVLEESTRMINDLGAIAREDAVRYTRADLTTAEDRLRTAREAMTAFRIKNQIVDPGSDFQTQAGLVAGLERQLAEAQIELDLLADVPPGDPRLTQVNRRISVITTRIAEERSRVGQPVGADGGVRDLAALASEHERLAVDREFAERAYIAALAAHDTAVAESLRNSRYLAAHVMPTSAEVSRFPERLSILGLLALGLMLLWSIATLVAYSLKDRR